MKLKFKLKNNPENGRSFAATERRNEPLCDEVLDSISGGSGGDAQIQVRSFMLSGHIPADEAKVGMYVYVSVDDEDRWYSGYITRIDEGSYWFIFPKRTYHIALTGYNGYGASGDAKFESTDVTLYTDMEWHW